MKITNCTIGDIDLIFEMYAEATKYQKERVTDYWPIFSRKMVKNEIINKRHFKLLINKNVACIWCINFNDQLIWAEKENNKSIYFHRIATHKNYRGNNYIKKIIGWGTKYALYATVGSAIHAPPELPIGTLDIDSTPPPIDI